MVPKEKSRMKLSEEKHIEQVVLKHNMSPTQVKMNIIAAFKHHNMSFFEYLDIDEG